MFQRVTLSLFIFTAAGTVVLMAGGVALLPAIVVSAFVVVVIGALFLASQFSSHGDLRDSGYEELEPTPGEPDDYQSRKYRQDLRERHLK